jgi:hypothetical protein
MFPLKIISYDVDKNIALRPVKDVKITRQRASPKSRALIAPLISFVVTAVGILDWLTALFTEMKRKRIATRRHKDEEFFWCNIKRRKKRNHSLFFYSRIYCICALNTFLSVISHFKPNPYVNERVAMFPRNPNLDAL